MKYIIIFNFLALTAINPIVNAHENHDHQIYIWSNSNDKTIKTDTTFNLKKLEDKKNKSKTSHKSN
tara:strand:+ start:213 stop:410 length:198 start_codon:yes stop_codon:yes gene_type:complete